MKPKKACTERSWEIVFPNDTNPHGTMFGGKMMAVMDKMAAIAAARYARKAVVTASTEAMDFINPVRVGDRIETFARVVWVGRTSMVIKVEVFSENPITGERRPCTSAHFNFVALDKDGRPSEIPQLVIESETEKRDSEVARIVKEQAIERKNRIAATARNNPDSN